ncbi:MAG: hypothetical protein AB8G22_07975, partial [Saprospiraceae bacterium]
MITVGIYFKTELSFANRRRLEYVLGILNDFPLLKGKAIWKINPAMQEVVERRIYYEYTVSSLADNSYFIPNQFKLFSTAQQLVCNKYQRGNDSIYSVEKVRKPAGLFLYQQQFGFDIFATIFYHLSRFEEYYANPEDWDQYDMLQEEKHLLVREKLEQIPIVDRLIIAFAKALKLPIEIPVTTYQLSHDIDTIRQFPSFYKYLRASIRILRDTFSLRKWWQLTSIYQRVLKKEIKDPHDTFDWLLLTNSLINNDLTKSRVVNKTVKNNHSFNIFTQVIFSQKVIYFLAGGKTKYENFYKITDSRVQEIIQLAKARGYQIGLHPSYLTWRNAEMLEKEKIKLEQIVGEEVIHSRQHFLHFDFKKTPELLVAAGIKEDSTLGYQNRIGFRCGTGFRYQMYDFKQEMSFDLWQTPMVVMDVALLTQANNDVAAWERVLLKFLKENQPGTEIVFNF